MLMMLAWLAGPGKNTVRLMLMMLAWLADPGENIVRLMLMMLPLWAGSGQKGGGADAHDASLVGWPVLEKHGVGRADDAC